MFIIIYFNRGESNYAYVYRKDELIKKIDLSNIMIAHQKGTLSSEKKARKNDVLRVAKFEKR